MSRTTLEPLYRTKGIKGRTARIAKYVSQPNGRYQDLTLTVQGETYRIPANVADEDRLKAIRLYAYEQIVNLKPEVTGSLAIFSYTQPSELGERVTVTCKKLL